MLSARTRAISNEISQVSQSINHPNQPTNQTKALIAVEQNATVYNVESTIKTNSTQTVLIISEV